MDFKVIKELIYLGEKVDVECKEAGEGLPKSIFETYSAFANTKGGTIILGVSENKKYKDPKKRYKLTGVSDSKKMQEDFWNTINSGKVNLNILVNDNVYIAKEDGIEILVIEVPRASFNMRPIYVGQNPFNGTFKRNYEGDYHATSSEVSAMIRDNNVEGNDNQIIEHYTMEDIDDETLKKYRTAFENRNEGHAWKFLSDKEFLERLGGYGKDRKTDVEGLTLAGLLMFGKGLPIRDRFSNIYMDYRNESNKTSDIRWIDRITYDGTWENNLFNFFNKVAPKLIEDLRKPFKLEGMQRIDDTPVHKAVREALVNMIVHADYMNDSGTLKVIKTEYGIEFTNPGILKLPVEEIYKGGNSKSRNPRMQTMLRMVGFGDNAGSGVPTILETWRREGWEQPVLIENTDLNQVTLILKINNENNANSSEFLKMMRSSLEPKYFDKILPIIEELEKKESVSPKEAMELVGKSASTVRRYFTLLTETGMVISEGDANKTRYKIKKH